MDGNVEFLAEALNKIEGGMDCELENHSQVKLFDPGNHVAMAPKIINLDYIDFGAGMALGSPALLYLVVWRSSFVFC